MNPPSPQAVFPDINTLLEGRRGEARFSVVPNTEPPVCVLYCVIEEEKKVDVVCIRTYRAGQS